MRPVGHLRHELTPLCSHTLACAPSCVSPFLSLSFPYSFFPLFFLSLFSVFQALFCGIKRASTMKTRTTCSAAFSDDSRATTNCRNLSSQKGTCMGMSRRGCSGEGGRDNDTKVINICKILCKSMCYLCTKYFVFSSPYSSPSSSFSSSPSSSPSSSGTPSSSTLPLNSPSPRAATGPGPRTVSTTS